MGAAVAALLNLVRFYRDPNPNPNSNPNPNPIPNLNPNPNPNPIPIPIPNPIPKVRFYRDAILAWAGAGVAAAEASHARTPSRRRPDDAGGAEI